MAVQDSKSDSKEIRCGILEYVNKDVSSFTGILKKRYTDFLVNEILPSGEVVHLTQLRPSKGHKQDFFTHGSRNEAGNRHAQGSHQKASHGSSPFSNTGFDGMSESKEAEVQPEVTAGSIDPGKLAEDRVRKSNFIPDTQDTTPETGDCPPVEKQNQLRQNDDPIKEIEESVAGEEQSSVRAPAPAKVDPKYEVPQTILLGVDKSRVARSQPHSVMEISTDITPEQTPTTDPLAHDVKAGSSKTAPPPPEPTAISEAEKLRAETGHQRFKTHLQMVDGEWRELTEDEEAHLQSVRLAEKAERQANGGDKIAISKGIVYGEDSMPAPKQNGVAMWNTYASDQSKPRDQHVAPAQPTQTSEDATQSLLDEQAAAEASEQTHAINPVSELLQISEQDRLTLERYFAPGIIDDLQSLYNRIIQTPNQPAKKYGSVRSPRISREARKQIHDDLRRIFHDKLQSETDADGCITIAATPRPANFPGRQQQDSRRSQGNDKNSQGRFPAQKGKQMWEDRGGEYLHFTLFKENKDTMECISWLMKQLKNKPRDFHFAGTKDRRAVTTQRVCVYRIYLDKLVSAGRSLKYAHIGNFEYRPEKLQLGDLSGNEFVITLRDCQFKGPQSENEAQTEASAIDVVTKSITSLNNGGFINYYGLQRFGTFAFSTDAIGTALLRGDYQAAVNGILSFNPACLEPEAEDADPANSISRDDRGRAQGINIFLQTGHVGRALDQIPRRFSAESTIIRHLSQPGHQNDFLGALKMMQRNHRLLYVHAYQSLVWNVVASERWRLHGNSVVEGDLVIVSKDSTGSDTNPTIDADGEVVVQAGEDDRAADLDDIFTRARPLSAAEAASGRYSIFDVVLPTPGFDVVYPANEVGAFYTKFMGSERGGGLDPHDMRRPYKDFSLSGSYRHLLARPLKPVTFELRTYTDDNEQFIETDYQKLQNERNHGRNNGSSWNQTGRSRAYDENWRKHTESPQTGIPLSSGGVPIAEADTKAPITNIESQPLPSGGVDISNHPRAQGTGANRGPLDNQHPPPDQQEQGTNAPSTEQKEKEKIAVIVRMQLGSSTYATMALREMMRGGVRTWKGEFGGGR